MSGETTAAAIPAAADVAAVWSSAGAAAEREERAPAGDAATAWLPAGEIRAGETWAGRQNAASVRQRGAAVTAVRKNIMIMTAAAVWREKIPPTVPA